VTRFYIDGKWVELDELVEKAEKWDFVRPAMAETIIELNDKLEAIKTKVKEYNDCDWLWDRDVVADSIFKDISKILEGEE